MAPQKSHKAVRALLAVVAARSDLLALRFARAVWPARGVAEPGGRPMEGKRSLTARWSDYRPSKAVWFWSCVICIAATMIVGFGWIGWVTKGTATAMADQAALQAKVNLAAAYCVSRFDAAPDASTQLAALKSKESWERSDFIEKGGWSNMSWMKTQVDGAADLCAKKLISASAPQNKAKST
jgi:hypothetical protein